MTIRRAVMVGMLAIAVRDATATSRVLVPGVTSSDCDSVLRVGLVSCRARPAESDRIPSVSEEQIRDYLSQYGKPPREAVRALLEPSDSNIAAWIRKQRQLISLASYVASRMTEMQSSPEAGLPRSAPSSASGLSSMFQMRVTLYVSNLDEVSLRAVRAMQQLVLVYPSVEGRLAQVGPGDAGPPWLIGFDTLLPLSVVPSGYVGPELPAIQLEDQRSGLSRWLSGPEITSQYIHDQIVGLRAEMARRGSMAN